MGETLIAIQQGDPVVAEEAVTFIGIGSAGDRGACRRLVYPAALSPLLVPIVYSVAGLCKNPDRTFNLDNVVLPHPTTRVIKTLGSTRVISFADGDEDVVVTEVWTGSDVRAAMTTALFRMFYEYLINAPPYEPTQTEYIQWEPRDRTDVVYNVELLSLSVGGGEGEARFDVIDFLEDGGINNGGDFENAMDGLNALPTGIIDREVRLRMRIISEVP